MFSNKQNNYRIDINGLRAWAVLSVVLYHFSVPGFDGGFVGVDVFFVISGFLMAKIIQTGLASGSFSLWSFYFSRARRIWPALIVLCAVVLLVGWLILMPLEYRALGKHARDSLLFSSNLRYLEEAGYFDVVSSGKWLLHTWSLSVEWQFYLVFPLLLMLLRRIGSSWAIVCLTLGAILLVSLFWSAWLSLSQPEEAFFTLKSRMWEMLAGCLVFFFCDRIRPIRSFWASVLSGLGFLLILVSIILLDSRFAWPGGWALLPVLGACLVILAEKQTSPLIRGAVFQWLGDRSYSIYLWHWPIMVGLVFLEKQDNVLWWLPGILLSLYLGHLSYLYVEGPARKCLSRWRPFKAGAILFLLLAIVLGAAQIIRKNDFSGRLPDAVAAMESESRKTPPRLNECTAQREECVFGTGPVRGIIIGDSHAGTLASVVQQSMDDASASLYMRARAGCLPVFGARKMNGRGTECLALQKWVRTELPNLYPGQPVILINRTTAYVMGGMPGEADQQENKPEYFFSRGYNSPEPAYLEEFRRHYIDTVCEIASHHPLYIVRNLPEMKVNVPYALARDMLLNRYRNLSLPLDEYHHRHGFMWSVQDEASARCGVKILNPLPYLCSATDCPATEDGYPLYYDDDHLGVRGSSKLLPMFQSIFRAEVQN
ncbi:MAG: acyltransferase family protein [Pseudomonadaceae bacterium]|nr:acyltransferase family protein [Pseudomonadaceae bacterium]